MISLKIIVKRFVAVRLRADDELMANFHQKPADLRVRCPHIVDVHACLAPARLRQVFTITNLVEALLADNALSFFSFLRRDFFWDGAAPPVNVVFRSIFQLLNFLIIIEAWQYLLELEVSMLVNLFSGPNDRSLGCQVADSELWASMLRDLNQRLILFHAPFGTRIQKTV